MVIHLFRKAVFFTALFAFAAASFAQTQEVKKKPIAHTSPTSGSEMFHAYCAPCHGKDGRGTGPAAPAMKTQPTDLRQLAKKNNGKLPADHIATLLRNGVSGAHGSVDMPVWGPLFAEVSSHNDAIVQMRIANLIAYIESLQAQ
jgi:mono/diheme cytochrome c family protein